MNFLQKVVVGLLCIVSSVLSFHSTSDAAILWQEDYEGTQAQINANWQASSCAGDFFVGSTPSISTTRAFSGSKSLKHVFTGHQPGHISAGYTQGPMGSSAGGGCFTDAIWATKVDEAWYTWYEYWDAGFIVDEISTKAIKPGDENKGSHWWGYHGGPYPPNIPPFFFGGSCCSNLIGRQLGFACQNCKDGSGTALGATWDPNAWGGKDYHQNMTGFTQPDDKWVCVENHLKYNTPGQANGMIETFQTNMTDGTPTIQSLGYYNLELRGARTTDPLPSDAGFQIVREYVQDGKGTIYRDKLMVSTTRVGCSGTPPPSDTTPPPVVSGVSGTVISSTQINWSWGAVTDPSGVTYNLERSIGAGAYTSVATNYAGTSYNNTGLVAGTLYNFRVRPVDGVGNLQQTWSNIATQTTSAAPADTTAPPVVTGLSGAVQSQTQINWTWNSVTDPSGVSYTLEGSTGTGNLTYTTIAPNLSTPSYNETGLVAGTVYNRRVRATDGVGNIQTTWSNVATATTQAAPPPSDTTPPPQVTINSVTTGTYTAIVAYTPVVDNSGGTVTYLIERSLAGCTGYSTDPPPGVGATTSSSFTDIGLSQNTTYCWRVKATDPTGNQSVVSANFQATTQLPSNPLGLGISNGMFTLGGIVTFLPTFSYFDVMNWHASDIDTMAARGWKGARIFVDWANDDGTPGDRSVCTAAGALQSSQVATVNAFIDYLDAKGMVTTMVILNEVSDDWMTTESARQTCVANVINAFKTRTRIKFDVVQEFDYSFTGDPLTSLTPAQVGAYNLIAKTACPTCIIYSSASSPLTHPADLTANIVGSVITLMTQNNQDVIAIHDYRSSNWWSITGARIAAYRNWLVSINKANVPVIFDEPNRHGFTYASTELEFNQAARDAKNAGAAEWTFHNGGNFEMGSTAMMSQLNATETAITISLVAGLTAGSGTEVPNILGSDTFTRADSTELGAEWEFGTEFNSLQIVSNTIRPLNTIVGSLERYIGVVLPANQGIRGKLVNATGASLQHLRLNVRLDPFPNYNGMYCAFNRNGTPVVSIVKRVVGVPSVLASSNTPTIAQDDILACEGYGTLYRALQNGIEILQATDGTYTAGAPGIYMSTDGATANFGFDNVEVYNFVAPVPLSLVSTLTTNATGADLTFTAPSYKIRYWNTNIISANAIEVSGLGGVMSYRHNIVHAPNVGFQCYQSQGVNGVWETDTWVCAGVTPGDTVAPSKPTILSID